MEIDSVAQLVHSARSRQIDVFVDGPASEDAIAVVELHMGHPLTPAFRVYLGQFGCISLCDTHLSGIVANDPLAPEGGNILFDTAQLRAREPSLPSSHWVIVGHEDGAYCLDFSVCPAGEPRVVNYEQGSSTSVAQSFSHFVASYLQALVV